MRCHPGCPPHVKMPTCVPLRSPKVTELCLLSPGRETRVPKNLRSLKIPLSVESQLVGVDNEDLSAQHILHQGGVSTALLLPDQHTPAIPQCTFRRRRLLPCTPRGIGLRFSRMREVGSLHFSQGPFHTPQSNPRRGRREVFL